LRTDDALLQEMNQLSEDNRHLLAELGREEPTKEAADEAAELEGLRAENAELRSTIAELKQVGELAPVADAEVWAAREKEYDSLLEEKSEVIRSLHLKLKELEVLASKASRKLPNEDELQATCDELERERAQLDTERHQQEQDRAQLQADEEALMKQMREMEMGMSRERAELARQRNDLQRLHHDIQHSLELASRDASLRDRLGPLQRRHQDITNRKGAAPAPEGRNGAAANGPAAPEAQASKKKQSGIFRRLFGSS
jgi:hypothetical protein